MFLLYILIPVILTNKILKLELSKKWIFKFFIYVWFFPLTALFSKPYYKELKNREKIKNKWWFVKVIWLMVILSILISSILISSINSLILKENYYKPFQVSWNAMFPAMYDKEFLLSKKEKEYKRKDIVIFKNPNDEELYFIKRIIGLPNETLKILSWSIFIKLENETEFKKLEENYVLKENNLEKIKEFEWMSYEIPENSYFMLWDNRDNSIASLECFKKSCEWWMTKYVNKELISWKPYLDLWYLNFKNLDFIHPELWINTYPKFFNINK